MADETVRAPAAEDASTVATNATVTRPCPSCQALQHANGRLVLERDGWQVIACPVCDFVYMAVVPRIERLADEIAWEKQFDREASRRRREMPIVEWLDQSTRWRLRLLPRATPAGLARGRVTGGRMVDLGCGNGDQALTMTPAFVPYGVEISIALARRAEAQLSGHGGACINAAAVDGLRSFEPGFFDLAVLRSFLEHEAEPNELLAAVALALRPGGIALVKVPNYACINRRVMGARWCGFRLPDHVNYFTPASLRAFGRRHGFAVALPFPWSLPTDDNMWAVFARTDNADPVGRA